jgi:hypothetical protein
MWRMGPQPLPEFISQSSASWTRHVGRTPWGSSGHMVVLAGCSGCRSRRAAFGLSVLSQRAASLLRIRLGLATCLVHGGDKDAGSRVRGGNIASR